MKQTCLHHFAMVRTGAYRCVRRTRSGLVVMGARRSEVKEEPTAQPVAGDMSGGGYPSPPSRGATANGKGDNQWAN